MNPQEAASAVSSRRSDKTESAPSDSRSVQRSAEVAAERPHRAVRRYLFLVVQLLPFIALTHVVEPRLTMAVALIVAGFMIHYWLPDRQKEPFWFAISAIGLFLLMDLKVASAIALATLMIFGILALGVSFWVRVALFSGFVGTVILVAPWLRLLFRQEESALFNEPFFFLFICTFGWRPILFFYYLYHSKEAVRLRDYLRNFCILPQYMFFDIPFIDSDVLRRRYQQRDIHVVAQEGIRWILRGAVQFTIGLVLAAQFPDWHPPSFVGDEAATSTDVVQLVGLQYFRLLPFLGTCNMAVGIMKLFGYDLPPATNNYALSRSPLDFWRRSNVYWKEAAQKLIFMPIFFRYRRSHPTVALFLGIGGVAAWTCAVNVWSDFWGSGLVRVHFGSQHWAWLSMGTAMTANALWEHSRNRCGSRLEKKRGIVGRAVKLGVHVAQVAGMFVFVALFMTLGRCQSFGAFVELLAWWS